MRQALHGNIVGAMISEVREQSCASGSAWQHCLRLRLRYNLFGYMNFEKKTKNEHQRNLGDPKSDNCPRVRATKYNRHYNKQFLRPKFEHKSK